MAGLSVGIIRPVLVDIARTYDISVALSGQLMTGAALAGLVGNLVLAPLMDRVDRRAAIVSALALITASSLFCALAPSFVALVIAYSAVGMGGITLLALVIASAGDLYGGSQRGQALGWILAGNVGVGLFVLPALSALVDPLGWPVVFYGFAGLCGVTTVVARATLPGDLRGQPAERVGYLATLGRIGHNRVAVILLLTIAAYHVSVYGFSTYAGAVAVERFAANSAQAGLVLSARALGMSVAGVLAGRFFGAGDWRVAAVATIAGAAFGLLGYAAVQTLWAYGAMLLLHGAAVGLADIAVVGLLLESEPTRRGSVTALRSVMEGVGGIAGPASGGAVLAASYSSAQGYGVAGGLFTLMALIAAGAVGLAGRLRASQVPPGTPGEEFEAAEG